MPTCQNPRPIITTQSLPEKFSVRKANDEGPASDAKVIDNYFVLIKKMWFGWPNDFWPIMEKREEGRCKPLKKVLTVKTMPAFQRTIETFVLQQRGQERRLTTARYDSNQARMNTQGNNIGDLDLVLNELDSFVTRRAASDEATVKISLPRASISVPGASVPESEVPVLPVSKTSPLMSDRRTALASSFSLPRVSVQLPLPNSPPLPVPRSVNSGRDLRRNQSLKYNSVIEEMGNRFSNATNEDEEYASIDEMDPRSSLSDNPLHTPQRMSHSSQTLHDQYRPPLNQESGTPAGPLQDLAMMRLKPYGEPRRQTDPCVGSNEEKLHLFREASRKLSEQSTVRKAIINFYNEDGSYKTIVVDENMNARDVIEVLVMKNRVERKITWQIFEDFEEEKLSRQVLDHENILEIFERWPMEKSYCFHLRNNLQKYEFFENPMEYLPEYMLDQLENDKSLTDKRKGEIQLRESDIKEMVLVKNTFLEIEGLLWIKDGDKKWKQAFTFVRYSGLYYSSKGRSKEPKYIHCLADFSEIHVYVCNDPHTGKKLFKAPTEFLLVFKKIRVSQTPKEITCICTRSKRSQKSLEQYVRNSKYGIEFLKRSFQATVDKHEKEKRYNDEILQSNLRKQLDELAKKELESLCNEDWYYGEISRAAGSEQILKDKKDGVFLVRKTYGKLYLSLCSNNNIHHFLIQSMEIDNCLHYTVEEGLYNFDSVRTLIAHYQKDAGSLPTKLQRPPNRKIM